MKTAARFELPPPRWEPLDRGAAFARLSGGQRAVLRELLAGEDVYVVAASATRTDVGSWLGPSRVGAVALADELLLFAPPRNPLGRLRRGSKSPRWFAQRIPMSRLGKSTYNHVTGQLLLAPAEDARVRALKLPPLEAYQLLAQIHHSQKDTPNA